MQIEVWKLLTALAAIGAAAGAPASTAMAQAPKSQQALPATPGGPSAPPAAKPAAEPERSGRRVVLRFLTTNDFPPFNYLDEDGVLTGFNVDLARAICLELAVPCDVGTRSWEDLTPTLGRRQADALIAGQLVTARALANVEFTDRYFTANIYPPIYVRRVRIAATDQIVFRF